MTHPQPTPNQPPQTQKAQDAEYYRRVLQELIDMGTELAKAIQQQGIRQAAPNPPADEASHPAQATSLAFERVIRTVRRTVLLAQHIAESPGAKPGPAQSRTAARKQVLRSLENAIHEEAEGGPESPHAEALHKELLDRLDAPDFDEDLLFRPIADIIGDIRRDLGIAVQFHSRPWKRRTPHDAATLHARAAAGPGAIPRPPPKDPAAPRPNHPPPTPNPQSPPRKPPPTLQEALAILKHR